MSDTEGFHTPYANYLERELGGIEEILGRLILAYLEGKTISPMIEEIEQWLGDDWWVNLSDEDQKRLDAIKGWTYG